MKFFPDTNLLLHMYSFEGYLSQCKIDAGDGEQSFELL